MDEKFIQEHILTLLNLDYLPDEKKAVLLDKMVEVVNQRLFLRIGEKLSPDKKEVLLKILENGQDGEVENFIAENIPDFLQILEEEILKLKQELAEQLEK